MDTPAAQSLLEAAQEIERLRGALREVVYEESGQWFTSWHSGTEVTNFVGGVLNPNPLYCEMCEGRGYVVADVVWPSGSPDRYAVQCSCKDRRRIPGR